MHAHGIDVLNRTDDDRVIRLVADNLHLELFPTEQAFVDQDLAHRGRIKTRQANALVVFLVVGNTAACPAKGEGRPDDRRQPKRLKCLPRLVQVCRNCGFRIFETDARHRFGEQLAILSHFNRGLLRPDQLDTETLQRAIIRQRQRGIQRRLTAHGRQQRVRLFFFDNLADEIRGDRLDIGGISQIRVRHDGRGVRVDQNDPIPLFAQGFYRLCAGVIELTCLSDHDGASSDYEDRGDVFAFWHGEASRLGRLGKRARSMLWRASMEPAIVAFLRNLPTKRFGA